MDNKKVMLTVAFVCVILAAIIFFMTSGGNRYDTKGKMMCFKCEKCERVIEMEANKYEDYMQQLTKGMSSMEIMGNPNLYVKCESCQSRMRIAIKDPRTNKVEIMGVSKK